MNDIALNVSVLLCGLGVAAAGIGVAVRLIRGPQRPDVIRVIEPAGKPEPTRRSIEETHVMRVVRDDTPRPWRHRPTRVDPDATRIVHPTRRNR